MRRLRTFVEAHHLDQIAVDYFGGGSPAYELGTRSIPWRSARGPYPGWLAVSATILKIAQGRWDPALGWQPEEAYAWLQGHAPMATIGYSIWVVDLRRLAEEPHGPAPPAVVEPRGIPILHRLRWLPRRNGQNMDGTDAG